MGPLSATCRSTAARVPRCGWGTGLPARAAPRYIVTTDADGQYNPAEMERVLAPVVSGEADFVTGSRKLGSQETNDPVRRLGTWVFAVTISVLTRQRITDSSFGLRAMRAEVTGAVRLEQPQYQSSELLIAVLAHGFRVAEVPATIHKRKVGESKKGHNAVYGLKFAGVVAGTWWRERQRRVPGSGSAPPSGGRPPARGPFGGASCPDGRTGRPGARPAARQRGRRGRRRPGRRFPARQRLLPRKPPTPTPWTRGPRKGRSGRSRTGR